jgi:hypothetical protein
MSLKKAMRFAIGLIVSIVLLAIALPYFGVSKAKFLPPTLVYQKAQGGITGQIVNKYSVQTNDPFKIGERMYFVQYIFTAPKVDQQPVQIPLINGKQVVNKKKKKPGDMDYLGEIRVNQNTYEYFKIGDGIQVRFEKTYPWVNGVDPAQGGQGVGVGEGSNVLSGWLIWAGLAVVMGGILATVIGHYSEKEDI